MKKLFLYIISITVLLSCEEKTSWDLEADAIPLLVVDGMITNEKKSHEVKLETTIQNANDTPEPVSGALVAITDQDNIFFLEESIDNPGIYKTNSSVQGVFGKIYTLYIQYENKEYTGSSFMVPVEPLPPFQVVPCEDNNDLYHLLVPEQGSPFVLQTEFSWFVDGAQHNESSLFYHVNSIDVNEFFKPDKEIICFPKGTLVKRKKYSLSDPQQKFIRSKLMETEWRGGLFDVERGNIETNMGGDVIGYFSANTVVSDSIFFNP